MIQEDARDYWDENARHAPRTRARGLTQNFMGKEPRIDPIELKDGLGMYVYKEYIGRAEKDYHNAPALVNWGKCGESPGNSMKEAYKTASADAFKVLRLEDGVVKGSNSFACILINQILKNNGLRTLTPHEYEQVLKTNPSYLAGETCVDSALVLLSENCTESRTARLTRDVSFQIYNWAGKVETPLLIPFHGLELKIDQDSSYGLGVKLKEDAEVIYAPELKFNNKYLQKFSERDKDGTILLEEDGKYGWAKFAKTNDKGLPVLDWYGSKFGSRSLEMDKEGLALMSLRAEKIWLDNNHHSVSSFRKKVFLTSS